jgi:hypothetical protein
MHRTYSDFDEWLHDRAHVLTGQPFDFEDYSCVPVLPEAQQAGPRESPVGFIVSHSGSITYVGAPAPGKSDDSWERVAHEWARYSADVQKRAALPTDCWFG